MTNEDLFHAANEMVTGACRAVNATSRGAPSIETLIRACEPEAARAVEALAAGGTLPLDQDRLRALLTAVLAISLWGFTTGMVTALLSAESEIEKLRRELGQRGEPPI